MTIEGVRLEGNALIVGDEHINVSALAMVGEAEAIEMLDRAFGDPGLARRWALALRKRERGEALVWMREQLRGSE